ncbi:MAG: AAA family ATPase [Deltaproteobacteria bacterium]|nr:AAA family ATPase [Deltaproteobacteria bacterium]
MYSSFFGFKENPFNLTPDPRYLFLSHYHREALDHLLYGINERKGFITITGGIGTGKTTLCRAFLSRLNASTKSALIFNSFISDRELLETINQEFGIGMNPSDKSKKDYVDALNDFLLDTFSSGGNAVLLLDEAQNLSQTVLEQIRMLSNLETEREKLIQIVLVGQPELREILVTPSLRQLDERITVRYHLKPLDRKDIQAYVAHRLVVSGSRGDVAFTDDAFKKIYAYSKGNPRRINAVCDRALLIAYSKETRDITKKLIGKAVQDIRGNLQADPLVSGLSGKKIRSVILLILLVIAAGLAGWNFRDFIFGLLPDGQKAVVVKSIKTFPLPPEPKQETPTLFLEGKTSLSTLYDLFDVETGENGYDMSQIHLGLVEFDIGPEYYVMFKKPFRVLVTGLSSSSLPSPSYLLIKKTTDDGAIAIDATGNERQVMRSYIFDHWGRSVSWIYPSKNISRPLVEGANGPDVVNVQKVLHEIGYLGNNTGIYDKSTSEQVSRFQRDFGLLADGVVGPRTRALLYQFEGK